METAGEFLNEIKPVPYLVFNEYDPILRRDTFNRIAKAICPGFIINEENKEIYEETIKYFAADESCKYDLRRGLYIYGKIGVGKTLYFKIFKALNRALESLNSFKTLTVNDLIDGFALEGPRYFASSGITPHDFQKRPNSRWYRPAHILIDDLGQSTKSVNYFGNNLNVVEDFIQRRYYVYTDFFALTHVSTNLVPNKINAEYGEFISSRMREMFNIILFPGEDKRK